MDEWIRECGARDMGEIEELDDGVYQLHYDFLDHNIGVVVGGESVFLVDTRASHRQARELRKDIGRITTLPVEWVVNSHWHWDHTWGELGVQGRRDLGARRVPETSGGPW